MCDLGGACPINNLLASPIALAAIVAICYGIGGPMTKYAINMGASLPALGIAYALGLLVATAGATYLYGVKPDVMLGSATGIKWAGLAGLVFGTAYVLIIKAFELPDGHLSIVGIVIASYPILTTGIALYFLGEASKVNLWYIIPGTLLTVGGVILVGLGGTSAE